MSVYTVLVVIAILLLCFIGVWAAVKFLLLPTAKKTAGGNLLDRWAALYGMDREFYGSDKSQAPNSHCCWSYQDQVRGMAWVESDCHLGDRISGMLRSE